MTIVVFVENRPFFGALLVHAPFLHALRARHPGARITLFSPFAEAELLVRLGVADEVRLYSKNVLRTSRALRAERADAVYSLRPYSLRTDLAIGASGVPGRMGFRSWLNTMLFTRTVPLDTAIYRPRKYLLLLPGVDARAASLEQWLHAPDRSPTLQPETWGRYVGVLPGGGAGEFKLWGIENFLAACEKLASRDPALQFVFVLGRPEAPLRERVEASPVAARSRCLVDESVPTLAAVARHAVAAFGNDCGPGHLFQMCGCRYACVMANHDGTAPARIAEWVDEPNRRYAVTTAGVADIRTIPVDEVVEQVVRALAARV